MLEVLEPGLATSIQDLGRPHLRALGVPLGGALDSHSARLANRLVGNRDDAAVLEVTLAGPLLQLLAPACIALCGGGFDIQVVPHDAREPAHPDRRLQTDDEAEPPQADCARHRSSRPPDNSRARPSLAARLPQWRPLLLDAGCTFRVGAARSGARLYLAVAGGIDVPRVLGSRSTALGAGFGGLEGRLLRAGDRLAFGPDSDRSWTHSERWQPLAPGIRAARWWISPAPTLQFERACCVRVLAGSDRLDAASQTSLHTGTFRVSARSNRMALRLEGPALSRAGSATRPSEPVAPGTVQLPNDGLPIVLQNDCQTTGGYPRIGHVISADLPRLAQLRPGQALHFAACSTEEARAAMREQNADLERLDLALQRTRGATMR